MCVIVVDNVVCDKHGRRLRKSGKSEKTWGV